jgi:Flp pilus assembly protein TadG
MKLRRRKDRARGGAMVEMALLIPLFSMFIFGQIEASRAGMVAQLLTNAAREGARVAVLPDTVDSTPVTARVNQVLSGSGLSFSSVDPTPSDWATAPRGTAITVKLVANYSSAQWMTPIYMKIKTMTASATMSSERN